MVLANPSLCQPNGWFEGNSEHVTVCDTQAQRERKESHGNGQFVSAQLPV
jgi:hypothetical protein